MKAKTKPLPPKTTQPNVWKQTAPDQWDSGDYRVKLVEGAPGDHPLYKSWGVFYRAKSGRYKRAKMADGSIRKYAHHGAAKVGAALMSRAKSHDK